MPDNIFGANNFTVEELDELFRDDEIAQETPPVTETETQTVDDASTSNTSKDEEVDTTKAFAKRLKESTDKVRREERESIAKSLGYTSYEVMQKEREHKILADKGLDVSEVSDAIEEIVKQRLDDDPRMKELADFKKMQIAEFGKKELAEITKLTNGEITTLSQLPSEVIESWRQKGSLVKAYMEHEGVNLINKIRSEQSKGSTSHLGNPTGGSTSDIKVRNLTKEEKDMWRAFLPNITEEELNKKTVSI